MILNHLPISAYSGVLKFDRKIFVNVARLEIGQLFTQGARRGHLWTLDTFLVLDLIFEKNGYIEQSQQKLKYPSSLSVVWTDLDICVWKFRSQNCELYTTTDSNQTAVLVGNNYLKITLPILFE